MRVFVALSALFWLAQPSPAAAQTEWIIDKERSSVSFTFVENGKEKTGRFESFAAQIRFDSARPEDASAFITVDTASIDLGDAMREGVLSSLPWFNSREFPGAVFRMNGLRAAGDGKYSAEGTLTIKNRERPVEVVMDVQFHGGNAQAKGVLDINRVDFRLRDALLESIVSIDETVSIGFDLIAEIEKE